jgi:hypothetical protein
VGDDRADSTSDGVVAPRSVFIKGLQEEQCTHSGFRQLVEANDEQHSPVKFRADTQSYRPKQAIVAVRQQMARGCG